MSGFEALYNAERMVRAHVEKERDTYKTNFEHCEARMIGLQVDNNVLQGQIADLRARIDAYEGQVAYAR